LIDPFLKKVSEKGYFGSEMIEKGDKLVFERPESEGSVHRDTCEIRYRVLLEGRTIIREEPTKICY